MHLQPKWNRRFRLFIGVLLAGPLLNAQSGAGRRHGGHAQQDVLSFVARPDGKWLWTPVRNWLDKTPKEQAIDVPGWTRTDLAAAFGLVLLDLFVTSDGRFVTWDSLISPADPSETRSFYLDGAQHLLLETNRRLLSLDVPSLSVAAGDDRDNVTIVGGSRETGNAKRVTLNGRTYQLVIDGGTKLKVSELRE